MNKSIKKIAAFSLIFCLLITIASVPVLAHNTSVAVGGSTITARHDKYSASATAETRNPSGGASSTSVSATILWVNPSNGDTGNISGGNMTSVTLRAPSGCSVVRVTSSHSASVGSHRWSWGPVFC